MDLGELAAPWNGWHIEHGYLCSPNGDRFTPHTLLACIFVRQMETYKHVLYGNWRETLNRPEN
jgi:hypothetical protein